MRAKNIFRLTFSLEILIENIISQNLHEIFKIKPLEIMYFLPYTKMEHLVNITIKIFNFYSCFK